MKTNFFHITWGVLLLIGIALVVASARVSEETRILMLQEGQIIETLTVISYFAAAAILFIQAVRRMPGRWALSFLVLSLGLRELDFDKQFTTMGIFTSRFYLSLEVPVVEKIAGVLVVVLLLSMLVVAVRAYLSGFLEGAKRRDGLVLSIALSMGALAFAKSIDGIGRKLRPLGIDLSDAASRNSAAIEEVLELLASVLILACATVAFRRSPKEDPDGETVLKIRL